MKAPIALFRCDASPGIGAGHVTRCLAFAETLSAAGWHVAFAVGRDTASTAPAITTSSCAVHQMGDDAEVEPAILRELYPAGADLLVIDHYGRDIEFERACRGWARSILAMDDGTGRQHDCDTLVDSAAADGAAYDGRVPPHTQLLLGPAYAMIRHRFLAQRARALQRRDGRPVENILLSFGATDPFNVTPDALEALNPFVDDLTITIAMSSRAPYVDDVRRRLRGRVRLLLDADMAEAMTETDLAVGAAGTTAFERAALGLPSVLLTLAENQRGITKLLSDAGAAIAAGEPDGTSYLRLASIVDFLISDASARRRMTQAAVSLVDGRGGQRLLVASGGESRTSTGAPVRLRLAERKDEEWLLGLQREPLTRRHFRTPTPPTAEEHARWMTSTIADPNVLLAIIMVAGHEAGFVRIDRSQRANCSHEVSIAISPRLRGRRIASAALALIRHLLPTAVFDAEIHPENAASRALFASAGFQQLDATWYRHPLQ